MRKALLVLVLAAGGCAMTPYQRVRAALIEAGVPDPVANCMADRMTKKLSVGQLKELRYLSRSKNDQGHFSTGEFVRRLREINDPEVVLVTSKAALRCSLTA